jgi:hypothetical protein
MSLVGLSHNDLHEKNIWVIPLKETKNILQEVDNIAYYLELTYEVKIFDFDRSYASIFGENRILLYQDNPLQKNEFVPNKDAIKICSSIYWYLDDDEKIFIKRLIMNDLEEIEKIDSFFSQDEEENKFLYSPEEYPGLTKDRNAFEQNFASVKTMIERLGKLVVSKNTFSPNKENIWNVNKDFMKVKY